MRSPAEHLSPSELVALSQSPDAIFVDGLDDGPIAQHLRSCDACLSLAEAHRKLGETGEGVAGAASGACPPMEEWLEFAAGLRPERSAERLAHASRCKECAELLREATELLRFEQLDGSVPAPGDLAPGDLASSTPAWQERLGARMAFAASSQPQAEKKAPLPFVSRRKFVLPLAAALLVGAAAVGGALLWRSAHPSDAQLLAEAYNTHRTLELRVPGADPVPMVTFTRGEGAGTSDPSALLALRLRAQQHLDKEPNSPYWHEILGEIDLLEQNGGAARRNLEIAQAADEHLPELKAYLAGAWFEIGEETGDKESYARAAELYSQELENHPSNPALLHFNLALCWERQNLNENALEDLRSALATEHSAAWRKAIQAEIDRLGGHAAAGLDAAAADHYEKDLDETVLSLLPQWESSADARARINQTATAGLQHGDRWLADWIDAPHTAATRQADKLLADSTAARNSGKLVDSMAQAVAATALYQGAQDQPGLARAKLAQLVGALNMGRAADCLTIAGEMQGGLKSRRYPTIETQLLLDRAACEFRAGDFNSSTRDLDEAGTLSAASRLPNSALTAEATKAQVLRHIGMTSAAWQANVAGLASCAAIDCSPGRKYSLLYNMVTCAEDLGQTNTALRIMQVAEPFSERSGNSLSHAYALEILATLEGRANQYDKAEDGFRRAFALYDKGKDPVKLYEAMWKIDHAEVLARRGDRQQALGMLQQSEASVTGSDYQPGRINFYRESADVRLILGDTDQALVNAKRSVEEAEPMLPTLHTPSQREQWSRENAAIYHTLVKTYIQRHEDALALQAFERFRSAPYRADFPAAQSSDAGGAGGAEQQRALVVGRIDDHYVGWLVAVPSLHVQRFAVLGESTHLLQSAITFYRLCADRDSSVADVRAVGRQLYTDLFGRFGADLEHTGKLWVDLDPSLGMLPLAALSTPSGGWFGDRTEVSVLPAWWSLEPGAAIAETPVTSGLNATILNGFAANVSSRAEATDVSQFFPGATALSGESATTAKILQSLSTAEVFHFSGHATATQERGIVISSQTPGAGTTITPATLEHAQLSRCRLTVLAACNTTSADPDQVEWLPNLRNALLQAGVKAVVASNWDVDDRSTHALVLAFYPALLSGLNPAHALQVAQQSVHAKHDWEHPYYWAAFETYTR